MTTDADTVHVEGGEGGLLKLDLARDADQVRIELTNREGKTIETLTVEDLKAGKNTLQLSGIAADNGDYGFKVTAIGAGGEFKPKVAVGGVVTGVIPGDEPVLIVNGREVSPSDVTAIELVHQG